MSLYPKGQRQTLKREKSTAQFPEVTLTGSGPWKLDHAMCVYVRDRRWPEGQRGAAGWMGAGSKTGWTRRWLGSEITG